MERRQQTRKVRKNRYFSIARSDLKSTKNSGRGARPRRSRGRPENHLSKRQNVRKGMEFRRWDGFPRLRLADSLDESNLLGPRHPLASGAEKSAALSLDNSANGPFSTRGTLFLVPGVDAVVMLIATFSVDGVAVGAIAEG